MESNPLPQVVVVEADGIQQWILGASSELRVIRGGSLLLDQAFGSIVEALTSLLGSPEPASDDPPTHGWQLLVRSSGAMTMTLGPQADIASIQDRVRAVLTREVPDLPTRFGAAPWTSEFSEARRAAIQQARSLQHFSVPTHIPTTMTCTSCGSASSARRGVRPGPGAAEWNLCGACERRARLTHDGIDTFPEGVQAEYDLRTIGAATTQGLRKVV